jgi:nucleoid DNA-binding protein
MNEKLHIAEIAELLAAAHNLPRKDAEVFVREFFTMIDEVLKQERYVKVKGFGTFKLIEVETRESVSISTGERIEIQGYTKISFTPDAALRELINKPFSHFENVVIYDDVILPDEQESEPLPAEQPVITPEPPAPQPEPAPERPVSETLPPAPEHPDTELLADNRRSTLRYFAGMVVFVVLIFGAGLLYMSHLHWFDNTYDAPPPAQTPPPTTQPVTIVAADTLASSTDTITATADTLHTETPKVTAPTPAVASTPTPTTPIPLPEQVEAVIKKEKQQPTAFAPDSTSYHIVGTLTTHTIQSGETLTRIALRYYGTKSLYPYIISYNTRVIKNPNNVPLGTVLQIPELEKKK